MEDAEEGIGGPIARGGEETGVGVLGKSGTVRNEKKGQDPGLSGEEVRGRAEKRERWDGTAVSFMGQWRMKKAKKSLPRQDWDQKAVQLEIEKGGRAAFIGGGIRKIGTKKYGKKKNAVALR